MKWLPYPENTPKHGRYLVSFKDSYYVAIVPFDRSYKDYIDGMRCYREAWVDEQNGETFENVIAFMELPKSFKG